MSKEGEHKRLVQGVVEVGGEAGTGEVSWEGDILSEVWVCVAPLRDMGGKDL